MDKPYCEAGCGELATVRLQYASYCADCASPHLRAALREVLGYKPCARVLRVGPKGSEYGAVCLHTYSNEHDHDF